MAVSIGCVANSDDPGVGKKAEKAKKQFAGCELAGKTLGVIGLGAIGAAVANAALSLGMRVLGYDPYLSINAAWSLDRNIKHVTDVNELYSNADFITIHVPATADTKAHDWCRRNCTHETRCGGA